MKTTEELQALYEDAHKALEEAIDNGCRLRLSVPAEPAKDHDLRISRALNELKPVALNNEEMEARITLAIHSELFSITNYPEPAQVHMMGEDITKLRNAVTSAVLEVLRA